MESRYKRTDTSHFNFGYIPQRLDIFCLYFRYITQYFDTSRKVTSPYILYVLKHHKVMYPTYTSRKMTCSTDTSRKIRIFKKNLNSRKFQRIQQNKLCIQVIRLIQCVSDVQLIHHVKYNFLYFFQNILKNIVK